MFLFFLFFYLFFIFIHFSFILYVFYIFPLFLFFACNSAFEQGYLEPWRYINAFIIIIIMVIAILWRNCRSFQPLLKVVDIGLTVAQTKYQN